MKVYRNVYIKANFPRLSGKEVIYYTGKIVNNADINGIVQREFDRSKDIYLGCDCDAPKYSAFIKKNENSKIQETNKRVILSYGRECKNCKRR